jgi:hypothetical protein
MEPVAVLAVSSAVSVAADAACVVALVVITGSERFVPAIAPARLACVVVTGLLVVSSLLDVVDRWALALACLGLLIGLQAVALAFGQLAPLRAYLDRRTASGEPVWWSDFERGFGRYVARRERRGRLCRARASGVGPLEPEDRVERSES